MANLALIVGYCQHNVAVAACIESMTSCDELEDFAWRYRLERVAGRFDLQGVCKDCQTQYNANKELLQKAS